MTGDNLYNVSTAITPVLQTTAHYAGAVGSAQLSDINRMSVSGDTMDCTNATDNSCKLLDLIWNVGATSQGGRVGFKSVINAANLATPRGLVSRPVHVNRIHPDGAARSFRPLSNER